MRAREFISEQANLPPEHRQALAQTFVLPGLSAQDPYRIYRTGVAMARARSEAKPDDINPYLEPWSSESVFGENAVVAGIDAGTEEIIDQALRMTNIPQGKRRVGSADPAGSSIVDSKSPIQGFRGYPR